MPDLQPSRELFLNPGEWFFGSGDIRLRTVLGSCVALVFWHRQRRLGGMCHYLLPLRRATKSKMLDGRYGNEALQLLLGAMREVKVPPTEFRVSVYGGGDMFPELARPDNHYVGHRNVEQAKRLLDLHHLQCDNQHVEGVGYRTVVFDLADGNVQLKYLALQRALSSPQGVGAI